MGLFVNNEAELILLEKLLTSFGTGEEITLELYGNDKVPSEGDEKADYTPCTFGGYSLVTIDADLWEYATVSGKGTAVYDSSPIVWTCSSASQTVYGYFCYDSDDVLLWSERFLTPVVLSVSDTPSLQPKLTLHSNN